MPRREIFADRLRKFLDKKTNENLRQISDRLKIDYLWLRRAVSQGLQHRTERTDKYLIPLCEDLGITPESLFLDKPDWTVNDLRRHLINHYPSQYYVAVAYYKSLDQLYVLSAIIETLHAKIDLDDCPTIDHEARLFCKWVSENFTITMND